MFRFNLYIAKPEPAEGVHVLVFASFRDIFERKIAIADNSRNPAVFYVFAVRNKDFLFGFGIKIEISLPRIFLFKIEKVNAVFLFYLLGKYGRGNDAFFYRAGRKLYLSSRGAAFMPQTGLHFAAFRRVE